jgi:hypothetical protein
MCYTEQIRQVIGQAKGAYLTGVCPPRLCLPSVKKPAYANLAISIHSLEAHRTLLQSGDA